MTAKFFLHNVEGGTIKVFTFSNPNYSYETQINFAKFAIADKYKINREDIEFIDYDYGNGEYIEIGG